MPKISVIIPVFNTEKYLEECLDSLIAQTLTDIEIIVVNDCSPGKCDEIVNEKALHDSRIRLVKNETNLGTFHTRRSGVLSAEGEFITFVDSDDSLNPNACEIIYNALISSHADVAHVACTRCTGSTKAHIPFSDDKDSHAFRCQEGVYTGKQWRDQLIEYDIDNCVWSYTIKKEYYLKTYKDLKDVSRLLMLEDFLLIFSVSAQNIGNCVYIADRLYNYRIDASGITQSIDNTDKLINMISDISYALLTTEKTLSISSYYSEQMLVKFKQRIFHDFEWYANQFFKLSDKEKILAIEQLNKKNTALLWLNLIARLGQKYSSNKYLIFSYSTIKEKLKMIIRLILGKK